jgi:hypothetical protein
MNKNEVKKIMEKKVNPRELAREQYDAYQDYIIQKLKGIIEGIENGNYEDIISEDTFISPAGDCMGMDNTVINFSFNETPCDIRQALNRLAFLAEYADGQREIDEVYNENVNYLEVD